MGTGKTVFMIDDDVNLVKVIKMVCEAKGYRFAAAHSAAQGLELITEVDPDVIILDVIMEEVAAFSKVPILMLTSVTAKTDLDFSERVGTSLLPVDAFVEKPVKPADLLAKIEELLERAISPGDTQS